MKGNSTSILRVLALCAILLLSTHLTYAYHYLLFGKSKVLNGELRIQLIAQPQQMRPPSHYWLNDTVLPKQMSSPSKYQKHPGQLSKTFKWGFAQTIISYSILIPVSATIMGVGASGINHDKEFGGHQTHIITPSYYEDDAQNLKKSKIMTSIGTVTLAASLTMAVIGPIMLKRFSQKDSLRFTPKVILHSGIAQTVLAYSIFLPGGLFLIQSGAEKSGYSDYGTIIRSPIVLSMGCLAVFAGITMGVIGPIRIAKGLRGQPLWLYKKHVTTPIKLTVTPRYNPFNQAVGMGFNMQF